MEHLTQNQRKIIILMCVIMIGIIYIIPTNPIFLIMAIVIAMLIGYNIVKLFLNRNK